MKSAYLLVAVVLVSGCTALDSIDIGSFGFEEGKQGPREILEISRISSIPQSPILPDETVDFSFIIRNVDSEKVANNVRVILFNAPGFKSTLFQGSPECNAPNGLCLADFCASPDLSPGEFVTLKNIGCIIGDIFPESETFINYVLKAPSDEDISGISTTLPLNFNVEYDFETTGKLRTNVVNNNYLISLQRAGESENIPRTIQSIGSGPVEVNMQLKNRDFVVAGREANFEFFVQEIGSGKLLRNEIGKGNLTISFSESFDDVCSLISINGQELVVTSIDNSDIDSNQNSDTVIPGVPTPSDDITPPPIPTANTDDDLKIGSNEDTVSFDTNPNFTCVNNVITNIEPVQLFTDGTSNKILIRLSEISFEGSSFKTVEMTANIKYTYQIEGRYNINVNPHGG